MMDAAALQETLDRLAADYVKRLGLRVDSVGPGAGDADACPSPAELVHGGGVALRPGDPGGRGHRDAGGDDRAARRVPADDDGAVADELRAAGAEEDSAAIAVVARVLRLGKSLSYGDVEFRTADGKLAAHATTTYALL